MEGAANTYEKNIPLTVDLDGTLLKRDSMIYMSLGALRRFDLFFPFTILGGRTCFKHYLAERHSPDLDALPWNAEVVDIVRAAQAEGRRALLVTAANESLAARVSERFGFDGYRGSTRETNLRGATKAGLLVAEFGERGFDYMGDSRVDLAVWARSRVAWVAESFGDTARVRAVCGDVRIFGFTPLRVGRDAG